MSDEYTDFKVGDEVVFIGPKWNGIHHFPKHWSHNEGVPMHDTVYHVRWVGIWDFNTGIHPGIKLVELMRYPYAPLENTAAYDCPFGARHFRKLIKTEISTKTEFEKLKKLADDVFTQKEKAMADE